MATDGVGACRGPRTPDRRTWVEIRLCIVDNVSHRTDGGLVPNRGPRGRDPPDLPGLEQYGSEWRLRTDYYQGIIEDVTGVDPADGPSTSELKTVQTRLEGCIETYEREGDCLCDEFSRYEYADSISTVHELARFFGVLVVTRAENPDYPRSDHCGTIRRSRSVRLAAFTRRCTRSRQSRHTAG